MSNSLKSLLKNVHLSLKPPTEGETYLTRENYDYYHYNCDGINDIGWGCGYRTLQTIFSMLSNKSNQESKIPSIQEIQETLVRIGDKEENFLGSRDWIGAAETCYIIDEYFQIPSYLHHITNSERISSKRKEIVDYFKTQGGLIAMGGDADASSKLIAGVHIANDKELSLLVVNPHFVGFPSNSSELISRGYVKWQTENEFIDESFYNLCMPKLL